jgi:hypothetical protein
MEHDPRREKVVTIHTAGSSTEAMVIRGLLESAGIASPGSSTTDPFPVGEAVEGFHETDVFVLESKAEEARRIIADYLKSNEGVELEEPEEDEDKAGQD